MPWPTGSGSARVNGGTPKARLPTGGPARGTGRGHLAASASATVNPGQGRRPSTPCSDRLAASTFTVREVRTEWPAAWTT